MIEVTTYAPSPQLAQRKVRADVAGQLRDRLQRLRVTLAGTQANDHAPRNAAMHDPLTTLPNRAHFRQRLGHSQALLLRAGRQLGLLCLGVNGCAQVSEIHGQGAGHECLRIVAARLRHVLRTDDVVGRVGDFEFAGMWPDLADPRRLAMIAGRLVAAVAAPLRIGSIEVSLSAHAGIAMFPHDGQGADVLLANAGAALFRAARQRSGHAFYGQPTER